MEGSYSVTSSCNAYLGSEDSCTLSIEGDPEGCLTLNIMLSKLLGSDIANKITSFLPKSLAIEYIEVNACDKMFLMEISSRPDFDIIPNVATLKGVEIIVEYTVPTKKLSFEITATWEIGQILFQVTGTKNDDGTSISGRTRPGGRRFNIAEIISAMASKLLPGNAVQTAVNAVGLNRINLRNLVLDSSFVDKGYGVRFSFKAVSNALNNPDLSITMNSVKKGSTSEKGITIAGSFRRLNIATLFRTLTTLDISSVPFVGTTVIRTLDMVYSSFQLGTPFIEYSSATMKDLYPIIKGTQMVTDIRFRNRGRGAKVKIIVIKPMVKFNILENSGITVKTFLDELVSNFGNIPLPPRFNLQTFFGITLTGFDYDADTKIFTLEAELSTPIVFVPNAVVLENAAIVFTVRTAGAPRKGGRIGFDFKANWRLANLVIPLSIGKPLGLSVFRAESRPDFEIPFGDLMTKFLVGLLPSGGLENAVKNAGFGSFSIVNPYVSIYFGSDIVVKISGTATIGAWDKCTVEAMIGQVSGAFVMATGIVVEDVPLTQIIKVMTGGALDLSGLPGVSILDSTDAAISMSSQSVPKAKKFMQFSIPALSQVQIINGVAMLARFKFPPGCTDKPCRTFKRLLGPAAQLIVKGQLRINSVQLAVLLPFNIEIYRGINITDLGFEIEFGLGTRSAILITGTLAIPDPALTFIGSFGISTSGVLLRMTMNGMWEKPFGIPFFAIGNLHIMAAITPDPIVLSAIEFGGQGKLGFLDNPNAQPLELSMYCGIDRVMVSENFFQGSISTLTIQGLLAAFAYRPNLPKPLAEIGFPDGLNTSYALKPKVLPNGVSVKTGYFLEGTLKVLFFQAFADIKVSLTGVYVNLNVNPFSLANGLVRVAGRSNTVGPRIYVDVSWQPPRAYINLEGSVRVLAISTYTNITVDHTGLSFEVSGSFFNLFEASIKITSSYDSIQTADFQAQGFFKNDLFDELERRVREELNDYKQKADEAIRNAESAISDAQTKFEDASQAVLSAQGTLDAQQRHFDSANSELESKKQDFEREKAKWDAAVAKVNDARNEVANKQRALDDAAASLRNLQNTACPPACRKRKLCFLKIHIQN